MQTSRVYLRLALFSLVWLGFASGAPADEAYQPTRQERAFLDELSQRSFLYFWEQGDPQTGLIPDRAHANGDPVQSDASVAAIGFALTGYCIAENRGWKPRPEIEERVLNTLRFLADECKTVRGFYYHFIDTESRQRAGKCELSSIDTALLLGGVLTARAYFEHAEIRRLATRIYERVEWPWMLNARDTLAMGWTPESGFMDPRWAHYDESMLLYILAIGSPTHPIAPESWQAVSRREVTNYGGRVFLSRAPLFTHQYSHAWIDFEHKRDEHADYWLNSRLATLAQQQYSVDLSDRFPAYSETMWGLTAGIGPEGYYPWGGPPTEARPAADGTVVPCAAGGSVPFAPEACIPTLYNIYATHGADVWRRYGLAGAFNPHTGWYARDLLGIDVGITLLMIENHRDRLVWNTFHQNPEIDRAMHAIGFRALPSRGRSPGRKVSLYGLKQRPADEREDLHPVALAWRSETHRPSHLDWHRVILPGGRSASFAFTWDDDHLAGHFRVPLEPGERAGPDRFPDSLSSIGLMIDPRSDGISTRDRADWRIELKSPALAQVVQGPDAAPRVLRTDMEVDPHRLTVRVFIPWAAMECLEAELWTSMRASPVFHHGPGRGGRTAWHLAKQGRKTVLGQLVLGGD